MDKNIESMISSYLEGGLSNKEKINFENYMDKNPKFLEKVNIMKNMISELNNQEMVMPSENFINNLNDKINNINPIITFNKANSIWFSNDFKTTLSFSFVIIIVSMFFINRLFISQNSVTITDSNNLNTNTSLLSEQDSLENNNIEFPIFQVKSSQDKK
tara:strand:- start:17 stop:493 length:477 start_codon:yes stop_codon:yes gene_type:complete